MTSREIWFFVRYTDLIRLMNRAVEGEDPESIAMELFVNCEHLKADEEDE